MDLGAYAPEVRVVIPAAGLGTRFSGQNLGLPKELLPLGGVPVIGHALAEAARAGFDSAVVVLSPAKQQIRDYLSVNGPPLPIEIVEQREASGIGDAVLRSWRGEPVGVLLPDDVVLETEHWSELLSIHAREGAAALCVRPVPTESISRFGIVTCEGDRVVGLIEKPPPGATSSNLAIFGRYIVTEPVIAGIGETHMPGERELTHGFAAAVARPPGVRAVRFTGEIYDCGTPAEYARSIARFGSKPA